MKTLTVILFLLFEEITGFAQSLSVGWSYNYLHSKQFDRSIQSYNFSRAFLENEQPLFMHGLCLDINYVFKNEQPLKYGVHANYTYFGSKAINPNYTNYLHLHLVNVNYILRFENSGKFKGLYEEISLGASSSGLFRRINGEVFLVDGERFKSLGIGGNIGVKVGYHLFKYQTYKLSPFVFCGYIPYLYAPKNEAVINGTQTLITSPYLNSITLKIGLILDMTK